MSASKNTLNAYKRRLIPANLSAEDRAVRVILASVFVGQFIFTVDAYFWQLIVSLFSLPLIVTAILAWDPIYSRLGIGAVAKSKLLPKSHPSGILISEAYAERLRKARYPTRYEVRDSVA